MKFAKLTLLVIPVLLLSACETGRTGGDLRAYCVSSKTTVDDHADALVTHGQKIINAGAGEVLVTGDQLITVYDKVCEQ
jgi:hypothetical protein